MLGESIIVQTHTEKRVSSYHSKGSFAIGILEYAESSSGSVSRETIRPEKSITIRQPISNTDKILKRWRADILFSQTIIVTIIAKTSGKHAHSIRDRLIINVTTDKR